MSETRVTPPELSQELGVQGGSEGEVGEWAVVGGVGLLVMSAVAGFANFGGLERLVTPGDVVRSANDIAASEGLFRAVIAALFVVVVLDIVVAVALYRVFSPVSKNISLLAATFRLVYAAVFLVAVGHLLNVLHLLDTPQTLGRELDAFNDLWLTGLGLFGCHLLVLGFLAYRSTYVPKVLGALLAIAGLGYVTDAIGAIFSRDLGVAAFTFLGEFLLAVWLVIRGRRITQ